MEGRDCTATVYDRALLKAGNRIAGPAIVMEMDSTTVILPGHHGRVDVHGNILIYPDGFRGAKKKQAGASRTRAAAKRASGPVRRAARKKARRAR
jgi:hypothetical protein